MDINWLDDQKVKLQLIRVSHYLLAYELLLSSVVDGVRDFYLTVFKDGELT
ncbi:MAG: hypothetical protein MAG431_01958 [Chloroflexi bacterium]|nr:hypothetical protein [Chloroflexota bacterium]